MKRLSEYISYLNNGKAALFIGAGISAIAGCSGLKEICEELRDFDDDIRKEIGSSEIDNKELFAFIKDKCNTPEHLHKYNGIIRKGLTPDDDLFNNKYHPLIKKIKKINPFPPLMTTNVDNCLESTREFDFSRIFYDPSDMLIDTFRNGGNFHLHGYIEDSKNQVWDLLDYERRYTPNFKDFLLAIFKNYSVLYLGYAFGDQELLSQMAKANKEHKKENTTPFLHFALMPTDDVPVNVNESIFMGLYNIKIIRYGSKSDFLDIIRNWLDSNFNSVSVGVSGTAMFTPSS